MNFYFIRCRLLLSFIIIMMANDWISCSFGKIFDKWKRGGEASWKDKNIELRETFHVSLKKQILFLRKLKYISSTSVRKFLVNEINSCLEYIGKFNYFNIYWLTFKTIANINISNMGDSVQKYSKNFNQFRV